MILTGGSTYTGGTTITAGTLQIGNGGPTGNIISNVTDNGSLIFNRSGNVTFKAIISGSGNLAQNGSGTTILGGTNTYSGGTTINNGTLIVNNSQALGLGNVVVNGGVLGADPQPINVKGNYTQNAGGTLQLQVAGAKPGQYDSLNVGGNATLGGALQLISLGFQPKAGNQLTLVTTGGVVSSRFALLNRVSRASSTIALLFSAFESSIVGELSWPLPYEVLFNLLGLPMKEDRQDLIKWSRSVKRKAGSRQKAEARPRYNLSSRADRRIYTHSEFGLK